MELLTVLKVPDPRLRMKAQPVVKVDDEIRELLQRMLAVVQTQDAVGLAANQVGILKRLVVIDFGPEVHPRPLLMVNPEIISRSTETAEFDEGCLSIPGVYVTVRRHKEVRVKYLDPQNQIQELSAEDLLADCLQHEIEHLDGILSIDHLSPLKRMFVLNKVEKYIKQQSRTTTPHVELT
jgi:peptide deformylase